MNIYIMEFDDYFFLSTYDEFPQFIDKNKNVNIRNMLYREIIYLARLSFKFPQDIAIDKFIALANEHHCKLVFSSWKQIPAFHSIQDAEDMKKEIESRIILNQLQDS